MPNLYETLLIVTPEADDEGVNAVIGDLRAALEANDGKVLQSGVWQRRQLAYQVKGKHEGIYVLVYAEGGTNLPAVVKHRLRLDEAVLRHLVVRVEDPQETDVRAQIAAADDPTGNVQAQRSAAERRAAKAAEAAAMSAAELEAQQEGEQEVEESQESREPESEGLPEAPEDGQGATSPPSGEETGERATSPPSGEETGEETGEGAKSSDSGEEASAGGAAPAVAGGAAGVGDRDRDDDDEDEDDFDDDDDDEDREI